jgi:hypothetical protein
VTAQPNKCEISGSRGGEYEDDSIIALMMEAVRTSETSLYFEPIRRYIPEGCHLQANTVRHYTLSHRF